MRVDPGNRLTFDLSFVIRAVRSQEAGHAVANSLLTNLGAEIRAGRRKLVEPTLFLIELMTVASRRSRDLDWGLVRQTLDLPLELMGFDAVSCETLMRVLNEHFPTEKRPHVGRGADLVYLSVARSASATLISCDGPLLSFDGPHFRVLSPEQCV